MPFCSVFNRARIVLRSGRFSGFSSQQSLMTSVTNLGVVSSSARRGRKGMSLSPLITLVIISKKDNFLCNFIRLYIIWINTKLSFFCKSIYQQIEANLHVFVCFWVAIGCLDIMKDDIGCPMTVFTPPHFCVFPKAGHHTFKFPEMTFCVFKYLTFCSGCYLYCGFIVYYMYCLTLLFKAEMSMP